MEVVGQSGGTNGMSDLISRGVEKSRERLGGKANKVSAGTELGVKATMELGGCTSMARVAVVSIGILMSSRTHGMKGNLTMDFGNALTALSSSDV